MIPPYMPQKTTRNSGRMLDSTTAPAPAPRVYQFPLAGLLELGLTMAGLFLVAHLIGAASVCQ
jgi:hypothetical protein